MGDLVKWIVAGAIGGAIGAAIWAGITYSTHHEIGWIAWGIGVLVGIAVRMAAGATDGFGPGIVAAVIAVLSICGGKYAASALLTRDAMAEISTMSFTEDNMIESLASEIADERTAAGKKLKWPPGKSEETAEVLADFPADVQAEAKKQWGAKPAEERQKLITERTEAFQNITNMVAGEIRKQGFLASFSPMDALFFLLAVMSAFKIGAGVTDGE
ncbi:MAG TPA: hypothetical protein VM452_08195 [Caulifigura sp.]|jgi:hypothetical protein|nr:hypothetical protein [Caulifigura sp.]